MSNDSLQSPEKLEARLKELQSAVDKERTLTAEAERRSRDLQGKLDLIGKVSIIFISHEGHFQSLDKSDTQDMKSSDFSSSSLAEAVTQVLSKNCRSNL